MYVILFVVGGGQGMGPLGIVVPWIRIFGPRHDNLGGCIGLRDSYYCCAARISLA